MDLILKDRPRPRSCIEHLEHPVAPYSGLLERYRAERRRRTGRWIATVGHASFRSPGQSSRHELQKWFLAIR